MKLLPRLYSLNFFSVFKVRYFEIVESQEIKQLHFRKLTLAQSTKVIVISAASYACTHLCVYHSLILSLV